MVQLPSYQDAVSRLDWLELVAPYVEYKDFTSLCSVSRRFNAVFAPRLWNDPLVVVRRLGLDPSDDLDWYLSFVFDRLQRVRLSTLDLVTTLDFRAFSKDTAQFSSSDNTNRTISESLRRLPELLPNLRCVLLDGHVEADPAFLTTTPPLGPGDVAAPREHNHDHLLVLSIAYCGTQLPSAFFTSHRLFHLVCLDVSGLPGSLQPLLAARRHLANLKILKARRREINDGLALQLFQTFGSRLWSLDIGENKVTDAIIDHIVASCLSSPSLRSHSRFMTEGRLISDGRGNDSHGRFMSIQESDLSGTFRHPERHFVDAPVYSADETRVLQEDEAVRSNGKGPLRRDTVDHLKAAVAGSMDRPVPLWTDVPHLDICAAPVGITHLHLSDTRITSAGIERLIRSSHGQIEDLSCDGSLFQPVQAVDETQPVSWPKGIRLYGILGCSHIFRPVFSSNLRSLRIHHSLVTQIPTIEVDGLYSALARLWIAETSIRRRSEMAFPQGFEPDMNPRLTSLTLTEIPRRSTGPLIQKLIHFLRLVGLQERAIEIASSSNRRGPATLNGLRHIRLEFEADPMEDPAGFSTSADLDAQGLMRMGEDEGYSFFDERPQSRPQSSGRRNKKAAGSEAISPFPDLQSAATRPPTRNTPSAAAAAARLVAPVGKRLELYPFSVFESEFMDYSGDSWAGRSFDRKVWIGPGTTRPDNPAVTEYAKMVTHPSLRARIGPATPDHVKAGVPAGALLFHAAWDAIVMPPTLDRPPNAELGAMRDVLEALKAYRIQTKAAHEAAKVRRDDEDVFWSGNLEVSAQQPTALYQSERYWR